MAVQTLARSFLARQPIFDARCRVRAYELLFRAGIENVFSGDPDAGSSRVIAHGSLVSDLQRLTGDSTIYINLTRDVLLDGLFRVLNPKTAVLEILETVEPQPDILEACRGAREAGYRVAIDDVIDPERLEAFRGVIDIVKVDFIDADAAQRRAIEQRAVAQGLRLLAEKVETEEEFEEARDAGYSLFQGYFLGRPRVVSAADVPAGKLALVQLVRELNRPELDPDRLEVLVKGDVALCFKLLRYINAVRFGFRDPVRSVRRAVILLGVREMRRWASLAALATLADDRPPVLIQQALIRARFYERLASIHGLHDRRDDLFLTGILSTLDAMLQRPLAELIEPLPVEPDVKSALIDGTGALAPTNEFAMAYEAGDWERATRAHRVDDESAVTEVYLEAIEWANRYFAPVDEPKLD